MSANVLTEKDRKQLGRAVEKAIANGRTVKVSAHERSMYYLTDYRSRRLARWRDVETAVYRLCCDIERRGVTKHDRHCVAAVVALLDDHLRLQRADF